MVPSSVVKKRVPKGTIPGIDSILEENEGINYFQ